MNLNVQIAGGPGISANRSLEVEAYDIINVDVRATASPPDTDKEIDVQPGGAGQVKFLAITSDRYGDGLTYKVNSAGNPSIALDQPHVLAGEGAVGLMDSAPTKLFFSTTLTEDASVLILVGRDATP